MGILTTYLTRMGERFPVPTRRASDKSEEPRRIRKSLSTSFVTTEKRCSPFFLRGRLGPSIFTYLKV